jgi:hypothetical protein
MVSTRTPPCVRPVSLTKCRIYFLFFLFGVFCLHRHQVRDFSGALPEGTETRKKKEAFPLLDEPHSFASSTGGFGGGGGGVCETGATRDKMNKDIMLWIVPVENRSEPTLFDDLGATGLFEHWVSCTDRGAPQRSTDPACFGPGCRCEM